MERDNFDKWTDQWEKAQASGIFGTPKQPQNPKQDDYHRPQNIVQDVDTEYWNKVYRLSNHMGDSPDPLEEEPDPAAGNEPVTISEDAPGKNDFKLVSTTKSDKKTSGKITDELGGLPNPVKAATRGKDANNRVTPNFAGGQEIIELHKMKEQLQKLEDKIAADPMVENKSTKKVMTQIDALWARIDELSDTLTPEFVQEYLS